MKVLAHSAKPKIGAPAQTYVEHVSGVVRRSKENIQAVTVYAQKLGRELLQVLVETGAEFHDLGKLDDDNQRELNSTGGKRLPLDHTDAGACLLMRKESLVGMYAAWLVYAHHRGLGSLHDEKQRRENMFRSFKEEVRERSNCELVNYLGVHLSEMKKEFLSCEITGGVPPSTIGLRIALSCLVDADHGDTGDYYERFRLPQQKNDIISGLNPKLRAVALDQYVGSLTPCDPLRMQVYETCKLADIEPNMYCCDSPVGTGKTTAVMRHLLEAAKTKGLRRVFVVLPFTNIINQSVKVYREALILPGENAENIVAANHHKADYQRPMARKLSETWQTPIVVTTAVQFFETLAAERPKDLRKLHQLPGSAIFIDESHASLPAKLWPQALRWLREMADLWGCHIVFASGSPVRYWEIEEFACDKVTSLPELLSEEMRQKVKEREDKRIIVRTKQEGMNADELIDWVCGFQGPRLLILNTVQSAAVIADLLCGKEKGKNVFSDNMQYMHVEHLSSALTPKDRERTIKRIQKRLEHRKKCTKINCGKCDWTLVATSVVEAGVDFSFRVAFRERSSLSSLIQTSGRVNRHLEKDLSEIWDFTLACDERLKVHPAFERSSVVVQQLLDEYQGNLGAEQCTEAMVREIRESGVMNEDPILTAESTYDFLQVAKKFRVIDSETVTAIIDENIAAKIRNHEPFNYREIMDNSVQIWSNKISYFNLAEIEDIDLFQWELGYDNFLGYMRGVLDMETFSSGCDCY